MQIRFAKRKNRIGRNALACGKRYGVYNINKFDNSTVRSWYESIISEELRSNVLLLLEMIFVRDGPLYVTINDAPVCSRHDLVPFIFMIDCLYLIIALFSAK